MPLVGFNLDIVTKSMYDIVNYIMGNQVNTRLFSFCMFSSPSKDFAFK